MVFKGSTRRSTSRDVPTTGPGLRLIANLAARSAQIRRKWEEGKRRGGESSKASSSLTILKIELPSCIPIQRRWIRSSGSKTMAEGAPKGRGKRERATVNWTDDTGKSWEWRESSVSLSEIRGKMGEMPRVREAKARWIPLDRMKMARIRWKDERLVDRLSLWRVLEEEGIVGAR